MPIPPIGDIAWAASPIASRPGRYQLVEPIQLYGQEMKSVISVQLGEIEIRRRRGCDLLAYRINSSRLIRLCGALGDQEGALPIFATVD